MNAIIATFLFKHCAYKVGWDQPKFICENTFRQINKQKQVKAHIEHMDGYRVVYIQTPITTKKIITHILDDPQSIIDFYDHPSFLINFEADEFWTTYQIEVYQTNDGILIHTQIINKLYTQKPSHIPKSNTLSKKLLEKQQ
jgi:hypothetical protein